MHPVWKTLIALGASAAGTIFWLVAGSCAIAYIATHPPRRRLKRTPAKFGAAFEEVQFPARDGVPLSGWFVPAQSAEAPRGAVILCHGMSANRAEVLPWAGTLWECGFALLLFDFRALGESGGNRCTAGYHETLDLRGAVDYLATRSDVAGLPLGVFGFSMGGATAILTAAEDDRIHAVATQGAFASLERAIRQRCRHHFGPLSRVAVWIILTINRWTRWFQAPMAEVSPIQAVSRLTPRPLLLLHGGKDKIIRPQDARDLHAAAGPPKALHVLPRSGHKRIHRAVRQEAHECVARFFREALPTPEGRLMGP